MRARTFTHSVKVKTIFVVVSLTRRKKKMSEIKKQLRLVPTTVSLAQVGIQKTRGANLETEWISTTNKRNRVCTLNIFIRKKKIKLWTKPTKKKQQRILFEYEARELWVSKRQWSWAQSVVAATAVVVNTILFHFVYFNNICAHTKKNVFFFADWKHPRWQIRYRHKCNQHIILLKRIQI